MIRKLDSDRINTCSSGSRGKFNIIIAEEISPKMKAVKYMDKEAHENELKQVLGDTQDAFDLSSDQIVVIGRHGNLIKISVV